MRAFFWAGKEKANGGQCLVAWSNICRPLNMGGLGVKNLQLQALALRVRWEWLRRTDCSRPWRGIPMTEDEEARQVFDSMVHIEVGDGTKVLFWRDRWIHGFAAADIAPSIVASVDTRVKNRRTVQQAMDDNRWTQDVRGDLSFTAHMQLLHLNQAIHTVQRQADAPDTFSWPADPSGQYTARSTYRWLCAGGVTSPFAACIWKSWATLKCKIFAWLAVQHRLWTSDRRARHGLQDHPSPCYTCLQCEENVEHILIQCMYAREVWEGCLSALHLNIPRPSTQDNYLQWWLSSRKHYQKAQKRGFDTLAIVVAWNLWKQHNARVFNRENLPRRDLIHKILQEIEEWRSAGVGVVGLHRFVRE